MSESLLACMRCAIYFKSGADWIDENLLAESRELKCTVVPEPEELRRIVLESVERNKESTKHIVDIVCGHIPESCRRLADDQQLLNGTEE